MSKAKPKYEILIRDIHEKLLDAAEDIRLLDIYTVDSDRSPTEDSYMCDAAQNIVSMLCEIKDCVAEYVDAIEYVQGNKKGFFVVIHEQVVNYDDRYYSADVREGYSVHGVEKNCIREIGKMRAQDARYNDADRSYYFRVLDKKYDTQEEAQKVARTMSDADIEKIFKTKAGGER